MTSAAQRVDGQEPGTRTVHGFCALCRSRCGARFVVQTQADGRERIAQVLPWPGHPTGGALCAKGRAAAELVEHPERLRVPLRRTRPKGDADPGWVEVGWDEALDDIARRLRAIRDESGAEAVAFAAASPGASAISDSLDWIERLIFAFGSPNFLTGVEICNWHRDHGHAFTFGQGIGMPDYEASDLVLLWGFNPGRVWLAQAQALARGRERGARLVVVDPARTHHARDADHWLRVTPGRDAALALGLANWLIAHRAFDEAFVREWTNAPFLVHPRGHRLLGERDLDPASATDHPLAWDIEAGRAVPIDTRAAPDLGRLSRLALEGRFMLDTPAGRMQAAPAFAHFAEACAPWTPPAVAATTGVPVEDFEAAARAIACARRVSYFCWSGISQHANASQADRAIALLMALTGSIDAPGGNRQLAALPAWRPNDRALLPPGQAERALGLARHPLGPPAHGWTLALDFQQAAIEGTPYRVRALVGFGANLLLSQPEPDRTAQALAALDLQVHCDVFENPTAHFADYLLPVNPPHEREALRVGFEISPEAVAQVQLRPRIVPPAPGDRSRSDLEIVFALAVRLGLGGLFFDGDHEAGWNRMLEPLGLDIEALRRREGGALRLPQAQGSQAHARRDLDGGVRGFATPSRRVEMFSSALAAVGMGGVPTAPRGDAARGGAFPLLLTCAKSGIFCQSQHRALPSLRRREPEPHVALHPSLAAARGIHAGDRVRVRTRAGEARFRVSLDPALDPGSVCASFGYWQACEALGLPASDPLSPGGRDFNALIDARDVDPVSGSLPLRAFDCDIALDPDAPGRSWSGWRVFEARVRARTGLDVLALDLLPLDGAALPAFRAGQHVPVCLWSDEGPGALVRRYSLTGRPGVAPAEGWSIGVKQVDGDGLSARLHAAAREGGRIRVGLAPPQGRFLLPAARRVPLVLVAGGVGITPFLSLLEGLSARDDAASGPPVLLLHASRDRAHHAFVERMATLRARLPRLEVLDAYSRAGAPSAAVLHDAPRRRVVTGRLHAGLVPQAFINGRARVCLCGPPALVESMRAGLLARGVAAHQMDSERFEAGAVLDPAPAGPFDLHFRRSGRVLRWQRGDGSLLDHAARAGLMLPSGCRVGQCESCALPLLRGEALHPSGIEAPEGQCLGCVAVPASDLEIDA